MTDKKMNDFLRIAADMKDQIHVLRRIQQRMLAQHRRRMELLDEVVAGQKRRDAKLDKLFAAVVDQEHDGDWWKKGEAPPWN